MSDLTNILNNENELSEEQLMKYLEGDLSPEERHEIELLMADSAFVNDAVEGLQDFKSTKKIDSYVEQLNRQLQKQTETKKKRKAKRKLKENDWVLWAVVIIIMLCTLGYWVIHKYIESK